jgi:hypothetical protein
MTDEARARIKKATESFANKELKKVSKQKRTKSKQPEREVERQILASLNARGWYLIKTDAKAVYSAAAGRFVNAKISAGTLDLTGSDADGNAVFLEVKAPGRIKNLSEGQLLTLVSHCRQGRFAIVADSIELVLAHHRTWQTCQDLSQRRKFLMDLLAPHLSKQKSPSDFSL